MRNYSKFLKIGIDMQYKIEAKANNKDAGIALKIVSIGLFIMLACIGIAAVLLAL